MLKEIKNIIPNVDMDPDKIYENAQFKRSKRPSFFRFKILIPALSSLIAVIAVIILIANLGNKGGHTTADTALTTANQTILRTNENENLGLVEYFEAYKTNEFDVLVLTVTNSSVSQIIFENPVEMVSIDDKVEGYINEDNMLAISLIDYDKKDYKLTLKLYKGYFDEHTDSYDNYECDPHKKVEPRYYSFFEFYIYSNYISDSSKNRIIYGIPVELIKNK